MGWLFGWNTRRALIDHLVSGNGVHTVKHCCVGNNLWAVQEYTHPETTYDGQLNPKAGQVARFIALYMMKGRNHSRDGWGYKDMDESSGPYVFSCPVSYLDMVPDPGGHATPWRNEVRRLHALKSRKLSVGQKIRIWSGDYEVMGKPYRDKTAYQVKCLDTGGTYKLPRKWMISVEVLT